MLVGLLLARVEDVFGPVYQHVEPHVFLLVLKREYDFVASKVILLKRYPFLCIYRKFLLPNLLVQALPFPMLNSIIAICLSLIEQLLFELKRV